MNYEFNLLHHVGVVAKRVCAAAAAHEGDDNTLSGPTGRGVKTAVRIKHDHFINRRITKLLFPYWSIIYDTTDLNHAYIPLKKILYFVCGYPENSQKMIKLKGPCVDPILNFYIRENPFQIS